MDSNVLGSQSIAVAAVIDPASIAVGDASTGWVAAGDYARLMAVLETGALGVAATVDMKLEQATDGTGTGVKDIPDKAITQIPKATGDNVQAIINLRPEEMDKNNGYSHMRATASVGVADSILGAQVLGLDARYGPVTQPASVVETVD